MCCPRLVGGGRTEGGDEKREWGVEVTSHDEVQRNTTEALRLGPLCCSAAL